MEKYEKYSQYVEHQKEKTNDPVRRKKWLTTEWDLKLQGFKKIFSRCMEENVLVSGQKALCIGARTGQEVQALLDLGMDAIGVDLVGHDSLVLEGDMHELPFKNKEFDFVFSNVFDHALYPDKKCSEIERVLKNNGHALLQFQVGIDQDKYTETFVHNPILDVIPHFNKSFPVYNRSVSRNFAGMNWEVLLKRDRALEHFDKKVGKIENVKVPDDYRKIWDDINLPVQERKAKNYRLSEEEKEKCLDQLHKRAYYLTTMAQNYKCKNIAEVGTAEGWQFFTFAKYAKNVGGHVWSCDPRDVRDKKYSKEYDDCSTFHLGTSDSLIEMIEEKIDLFYVDGSHDKGDVLRDVLNLRKRQSENPVWIFDDFDVRFGCYHDLKALCKHAEKYLIYRVGNTASGNPSHQLIVFGRL